MGVVNSGCLSIASTAVGSGVTPSITRSKVARVTPSWEALTRMSSTHASKSAAASPAAADTSAATVSVRRGLMVVGRTAVCWAPARKASARRELSRAAPFLTRSNRVAILSATVSRFLPRRRSLWTLGAVVLLCGAIARAAPATQKGRRGKQSAPAAEAAPEAAKAAPAPLDGVRWQLKSYRGADGNPVTPIHGDRPTIRFRSGRIITGSGGCNTFTAGYTYDAGRLTVSHPAVSSGTCPEPAMEQEASYLAALHHVASFALNDNVLTLDDA